MSGATGRPRAGGQDGAAGVEVGQVDPDVAVEAAGPHDRRVEVSRWLVAAMTIRSCTGAPLLERLQQLVDDALLSWSEPSSRRSAIESNSSKNSSTARCGRPR